MKWCFDKRYSVASVPLEQLDWNNWFTDTSAGFYLHVHHKDGESIFRVFPRTKLQGKVLNQYRLGMIDGKLFWIEPNKKRSGK